MRGLLDGRFATRPHALIEHRGSTALVLEDPGGVSLAALPKESLPLGRFLLVAANLASALGALHGRGLIHKDIRPANILVNPETGDAALTGFGIASHAISTPLYLPDYPLGHLIAFQIEEHVRKQGKLGPEFERMAKYGSVLPDLWMKHAAGEPISAGPLLRAADKVVAGKP